MVGSSTALQELTPCAPDRQCARNRGCGPGRVLSNRLLSDRAWLVELMAATASAMCNNRSQPTFTELPVNLPSLTHQSGHLKHLAAKPYAGHHRL